MQILDSLKRDPEKMKLLYLPKLMENIQKVDTPSYEKFQSNLSIFHPRIVVNMLDNPKDAEAAIKIKRSCEAYLGLAVEHLGVIYRDSAQDIALASRLPVYLYKPQSLISQAVNRIADKILSMPEETVTIDREYVDDSYDAAASEAEMDFENRLDYVDELLHSGEISRGEMIETIKTQQLEIGKLRRENSFIKLKLSKAAQAGFKV
jgi:flagellar biosynthesis protein FlhG